MEEVCLLPNEAELELKSLFLWMVVSLEDFNNRRNPARSSERRRSNLVKIRLDPMEAAPQPLEGFRSRCDWSLPSQAARR